MSFGFRVISCAIIQNFLQKCPSRFGEVSAAVLQQQSKIGRINVKGLIRKINWLHDNIKCMAFYGFVKKITAFYREVFNHAKVAPRPKLIPHVTIHVTSCPEMWFSPTQARARVRARARARARAFQKCPSGVPRADFVSLGVPQNFEVSLGVPQFFRSVPHSEGHI